MPSRAGPENYSTGLTVSPAVRPGVALAVALAVLALASAAATLPSATQDATEATRPTAPRETPATPSTSTPTSAAAAPQPDSSAVDPDCAVGCAGGEGVLDRLPVLPSLDPGALAVLVAAALAGLSLLAYRAAGDEGAALADDARGDERPGPPPAGRGANPRPVPGDAPADNAVYRAWRDLTAGLDVSRAEARTPAELAAAAVERGADAGAVGELRGLFVAVRYGGRPPTADREERARDARRRAGGDAVDSGRSAAGERDGAGGDDAGGSDP